MQSSVCGMVALVVFGAYCVTGVALGARLVKYAKHRPLGFAAWRADSYSPEGQPLFKVLRRGWMGWGAFVVLLLIGFTAGLICRFIPTKRDPLSGAAQILPQTSRRDDPHRRFREGEQVLVATHEYIRLRSYRLRYDRRIPLIQPLEPALPPSLHHRRLAPQVNFDFLNRVRWDAKLPPQDALHLVQNGLAEHQFMLGEDGVDTLVSRKIFTTRRGRCPRRSGSLAPQPAA